MRQNRYFIAVDVAGRVGNAVEDAQQRLVRDQTGLMEPLQPHITLLNPDMLSSLSPMYLLPKIRQLIPEYMPLRIKLRVIKTFSNRVAYISADSPALHEMRQEIVKLLPHSIQAAHTVSREFTPHVTIAQARPMQKLPEGLLESLKRQVGSVLPADFETRHLTMFTWQEPRTYKKELI